MALFSLSHRSFGKGGNGYVAGSCAKHANYITRESACSKIVGERMPTSRGGICAWLNEQEEASRKNGRLIDKVMVALPIELTHEQRVELVTDFCNAMTKGRASWVAAIHDKEPDADNPHAHIIFRDKDFETGRRVMFTSASAREAAQLEATKGVEVINTQAMRVHWAEHTNEAYQRLGLDHRIDHRTLKAQGIDRAPDVHRGPDIPLERFQQSEIDLAPGRERDPTPDHSGARALSHTSHVQSPAPEIMRGPTSGQPFDNVRATELEQEQEEQRRSGDAGGNMDWTDRGGMVAQQRSAMQAARLTAFDQMVERQQGDRQAEVRDGKLEISDRDRERMARLAAFDRMIDQQRERGDREQLSDIGRSRERD